MTAAATKPWRVFRQRPDLPDAEVSAHRWEWLAYLCACRRTAAHCNWTGGFYTVRRADA
jgi:hypothetical protein